MYIVYTILSLYYIRTKSEWKWWACFCCVVTKKKERKRKRAVGV